MSFFIPLLSFVEDELLLILFILFIIFEFEFEFELDSSSNFCTDICSIDEISFKELFSWKILLLILLLILFLNCIELSKFKFKLNLLRLLLLYKESEYSSLLFKSEKLFI